MMVIRMAIMTTRIMIRMIRIISSSAAYVERGNVSARLFWLWGGRLARLMGWGVVVGDVVVMMGDVVVMGDVRAEERGVEGEWR